MIRHFFPAVKPLLALLLVLSPLAFALVRAAPLNLVLALSKESGAYQEYANALAGQLAGKNVELTVIDADQPFPDADLVISAGLKAATAAAIYKPRAMLVVLIPKESFVKFKNDFPAQAAGGENVYSAVYLDQPFKRQVDLVAAALPGAKSIGVLYASQPNELFVLRKQVSARKLLLNEHFLSPGEGLSASLQDLLGKSDVLLALPDAEIFNTSTIRNILLETYRNRVPLVGFSAAYVKAGALCAIFSTPGQLARQSLEIIQGYTATRKLPAPQYANDFDVSVNEQVAHSLGLNIKSAAQLRKEIGVAP